MSNIDSVLTSLVSTPFVLLLVCEPAAVVHEASVLRLAGRRVCSLLFEVLIVGRCSSSLYVWL